MDKEFPRLEKVKIDSHKRRPSRPNSMVKVSSVFNNILHALDLAENDVGHVSNFQSPARVDIMNPTEVKQAVKDISVKGIDQGVVSPMISYPSNISLHSASLA